MHEKKVSQKRTSANCGKKFNSTTEGKASSSAGCTHDASKKSAEKETQVSKTQLKTELGLRRPPNIVGRRGLATIFSGTSKRQEQDLRESG